MKFKPDHGHCRLTLSKEKYTILSSLKTEDEKLKFLNEYYSSLGANKFIKQFITQNEEIMIGNLDGTESEF